MVNSNVNALGVIFANTYDNLVPELVAERSMASIPFGGRYRLIDFTLSSMANAGIDNVSVIVRKNYHSLMDHLGAGREWDLTRKRGGLNIAEPGDVATVGSGVVIGKGAVVGPKAMVSSDVKDGEEQW